MLVSVHSSDGGESISNTFKRNGGLGLGNLKKKNVALLGKWLWRFPLEQQSFWAKIIKSKYDIQSNGWDSECDKKGII